MFRLLFALSFVFILSTFAVSKNQFGSKNGTQQSQCGKSVSKDSCSCRDGRDGRDGQNGKDGRDGRDGKIGTKGDRGERGPKGNDGMNGLKGVKGEQGFHGKDGINGTKGQKGETGPAGKSPQGAVKFGDTAEKCTLRTAGTVRYNVSQKALQLCDGSAWLPLVIGGKGHVANRPGLHCMDILKSGGSRDSGLYWIDPNGGSTDDSFQAFCDMETEGGGWTLVAAKVSPSFLIIKTAFSASAAKTTDADAASHIHPNMGDWEEVMFRFNDVNTIRVVYNRKAGAPNKDKTTYNTIKNIHGFYKYSPADHNKRNPSSGFATISRLHFFSKYGISEDHGGTDKWIDMWYGADGSNNYVTSDDRRARGTKCIAGYCYLNKPIWVMVCSNATHQTRCGNSCFTDYICRDGRDGRDGRNGKHGRDGRDGKNAGEKGGKGEQGAPGDEGMRGIKGEQGLQGVPGDDGMRGIKGNKGGQGFKGQKGEPGSSLTRKHPGGIFKFDDVPAFNCTPNTAGTVRYNVSQNALQFCDGRSWLFLLTAPVANTKKVKKGHESQNPGRHCLDILNAGDSRGSGLYWIDPNGGSKDDSFQAFCDMDTNGGGWTLVATKVSPSFLFIKTAFSTSAAKTTDADAASHIHTDMGDWEEVMFRFSDVSTIQVIYDRKAGAPNKDKTDFDKFLMGTTYNTIKNVHGFYKYSPADHNKRNPSSGFATISKLYFYLNGGISEAHVGSDKWIDMWHSAEILNNYVTSDDSRAIGTKCIAGYCYLNKPIWVMVR